MICLVVGEHIVEGLSELIGTLLDLQLLPVDLVLNVVDPLVQLGDVHLTVLKSRIKDIYILWFSLVVIYLSMHISIYLCRFEYGEMNITKLNQRIYLDLYIYVYLSIYIKKF